MRNKYVGRPSLLYNLCKNVDNDDDDEDMSVFLHSSLFSLVLKYSIASLFIFIYLRLILFLGFSFVSDKSRSVHLELPSVKLIIFLLFFFLFTHIYFSRNMFHARTRIAAGPCLVEKIFQPFLLRYENQDQTSLDNGTMFLYYFRHKTNAMDHFGNGDTFRCDTECFSSGRKFTRRYRRNFAIISMKCESQSCRRPRPWT